MDVDRPTFEHRSTDMPRRDDRSRFDRRNWSKPGRQSQSVAIDEVDLDVIGAAKSGRSLRDCVKNRLQIGRRTGDDPEDLARRCLPFQRLGYLAVGCRQRAVLLLQLCKKPYVFDGDDCFVGESMEQLDLVVGEWANLPAADCYC